MSPEEVHNFGSRLYIDKRGIPLICSLSGSFLESKNNKAKAPFTIFGERKKRLKALLIASSRQNVKRSLQCLNNVHYTYFKLVQSVFTLPDDRKIPAIHIFRVR